MGGVIELSVSEGDGSGVTVHLNNKQLRSYNANITPQSLNDTIERHPQTHSTHSPLLLAQAAPFLLLVNDKGLLVVERLDLERERRLVLAPSGGALRLLCASGATTSNAAQCTRSVCIAVESTALLPVLRSTVWPSIAAVPGPPKPLPGGS